MKYRHSLSAAALLAIIASTPAMAGDYAVPTRYGMLHFVDGQVLALDGRKMLQVSPEKHAGKTYAVGIHQDGTSDMVLFADTSEGCAEKQVLLVTVFGSSVLSTKTYGDCTAIVKLRVTLDGQLVEEG